MTNREYDEDDIRKRLMEVLGVKRVQIETVVQVICETDGRDPKVNREIYQAEREIRKAYPLAGFDFFVFYGAAPEDEVGIVDGPHWSSNVR